MPPQPNFSQHPTFPRCQLLPLEEQVKTLGANRASALGAKLQPDFTEYLKNRPHRRTGRVLHEDVLVGRGRQPHRDAPLSILQTHELPGNFITRLLETGQISPARLPSGHDVQVQVEVLYRAF